jgi:hypothetical protein
MFVGVFLWYVLFSLPSVWFIRYFSVPGIPFGNLGVTCAYIGTLVLTFLIGMWSGWIFGAAFSNNKAIRLLGGIPVLLYLFSLQWLVIAGKLAPF